MPSRKTSEPAAAATAQRARRKTAPARAQPTQVPEAPPPRPSFRERMQVAREEAILDAVNHLLATKGYDAMTVDEVAAEAGVAKASMYRHYPGKEALAAAAMFSNNAWAERTLSSALPYCPA